MGLWIEFNLFEDVFRKCYFYKYNIKKWCLIVYCYRIRFFNKVNVNFVNEGMFKWKGWVKY